MKSLIGLILGCAVTLSTAAEFNAQVGPRPYYLIEQMAASDLKTRLQSCAEGPFPANDFSISHRGAPLQFPEHTKESYQAAARMGAGIIECDVTFTADGELVCRHAQCDLHATTDIVARPELRDKCHVPPEFDASGELRNAAQITCCATDLELAEFRSLCGKMDGFNQHARDVEQYLAGTPAYRTELYSSCATLLSHADSIALLKTLGVKFTPELKGVQTNADGRPALPEAGFGESGLNQQRYANQLIADYQAAKVNPGDVFVQSFDFDDIIFWIDEHPEYARQAVYLINQPEDLAPSELRAHFAKLHHRGVRILGVPIGALLSLDGQGSLIASDYARAARHSGLELIAWSAERSGRMREDVKPRGGGFYYSSINAAIADDGAVMEILHALATQAGVLGVFSDWPGTVTYYASCLSKRPTAGAER